ncbi:hypothetical protein DCC85_18650 [Paenibacillus sp. CAA11]|uniref:hypothetical protein n=1 Tax=Paenibacillus sp. CAA11 TaxID=1532905 RepID=UPI000D3C330A|nr:hypothetical protein [Paenibacillus sp. CAA11]AWB45990.1 hypothetical protein DCC85_18650 [Paenibacillus sp. CAA11]
MINIWILLLALLSPMNVHGPQTAGQDLTVQPSARLAVAQTWRASWAEKLTSFDSLNGVSLSDTRDTLLHKRGRPAKVTQDPITGYIEYHYKDATVGLYDNWVYYVHCDPNQKVSINGREISLEDKAIVQALGDPDDSAEDGDVYIRGLAAIKIYRNSTGEITGLDLFDTTAS